MTSRKLLAPATRAFSLTTGTGFQHLRPQAMVCAPRGRLPNVGPLPFSAVPLSSASRGALPALSSVGSASTLQGPAFTSLRQFSSSSGGGKMPVWMSTDGEKPAEMFRDLDCYGRNVVVLCYHLIQEKGEQVEGSLSEKMKVLEGNLILKIQAVPDKSKMKVDKLSVQDWLSIFRHVAWVSVGMYVYSLSAEFTGRCLEALGQMRKHAPEIYSVMVAAAKDDLWHWPFTKRVKLVIQDRWWIDPEKQAIRDKKKELQRALKNKEDSSKK